MKTFKDLAFKQHSSTCGAGTMALINFDNGFGVSVISGPMFYTNSEFPYEVAILHNGSICYWSGITTDVIGWQTSDDVTKIMQAVQGLEPKTDNNYKCAGN